MILCEKKKQRDGGLGFLADFELDMINPISTADIHLLSQLPTL